MKQLPLIASQLYAVPWGIMPETHGELGALYRRWITGELKVRGDWSDPEDDPATEEKKRVRCGLPTDILMGGRLVVIHACGIVVKHQLPEMCGPQMLDLADLDASLAEHAETAETIVLHIDSPGGSGLGMEETSQRIDAIRESGVRMVAYTDTQAASNGYRLASGCNEIWAAPSALIGCLGTYIAALDDSRQWEMQGLQLKLFRDGAIKAVGHPGKRWTPEEEAFLQGLVDNASARFKGYIAGRRPGLTPDDMQGQWWPAMDAPPAAVDGFAADLEALVTVEAERLTA